jgi:EVE domain
VRTWILTASPSNHAATAERGFTVFGFKERRRNQALEVAPGDRFVLYLTQVMSFAGAIRVSGDLYEERTKIWPGKPGSPDIYPWRFPTEPEVVLDEADWVPAETLVGRLEHMAKWPPEHWRLAFQGQVRAVSERDASVLLDAMRAGAPA